MKIEVMLHLLFIISVLVNLTVEATKKISPKADEKADYVAMIASVLLTVGVCTVYVVMESIAVTAQFIVSAIVLTYFAFLVATLGYDKVMAAIEQILKKGAQS